LVHSLRVLRAWGLTLRRALVPVLVLLALAVAAALVFLGKSKVPPESQRSAPIDPAAGLRADEARSTTRADVEPVLPSSERAAPSAAPGLAAVQRYTGPVRDRARADLLREALAALYAGQLSAAADAPEPEPSMPVPEGTDNQADKPLGQYVGRVMREQFVPLAAACYEELLIAQPSAQGVVELAFSIMGDQAVGGVVVDVSLSDGTAIKDETFARCVRESMYAVVFDAPPPGHPAVSVTQSFELAP
jgi:hypothetical protein